MDQLKLFENLLSEVSQITYSKREQFDLIEERAKMYVRKFFGDNSHYLKDLNSIRYSPAIYISGVDPDYRSSFEGGLKRFKKIITIIIEDINLSTNYPASISTTTTTTMPPVATPTTIANPGKRKALDGQTIQILIASHQM